MADDDDDNQVIANDQKKNPDCSYSRSFSKSCSFNSERGGMVCQMIRQVVRQCPGKGAVTILEKSSSNTDNKAAGPMPNIFDGIFGAWGKQGDQSAEDGLKEIESMMKKALEGPGILPQPPPSKRPAMPPPRQNQPKGKWSIADYDKFPSADDDNDGEIERA